MRPALRMFHHRRRDYRNWQTQIKSQQQEIAAQQQQTESLKRQLQLQTAAVQERLSRPERVLGIQAQVLAKK